MELGSVETGGLRLAGIVGGERDKSIVKGSSESGVGDRRETGQGRRDRVVELDVGSRLLPKTRSMCSSITELDPEAKGT
jgi:hypothetical protein